MAFFLHFLTFLCRNKVTICFANSELFLKQNMLHDPPFSLEIHSLLPMTNISSGAPTKISLARRSQHESTPNTLSYWDLGLSSRNSRNLNTLHCQDFQKPGIRLKLKCIYNSGFNWMCHTLLAKSSSYEEGQRNC